MRINIRDMDNPQLKPIQEINECGQSILIKYLSQTTRSSACYAITFSDFIPIANELKGVKEYQLHDFASITCLINQTLQMKHTHREEREEGYRQINDFQRIAPQILIPCKVDIAMHWHIACRSFYLRYSLGGFLLSHIQWLHTNFGTRRSKAFQVSIDFCFSFEFNGSQNSINLNKNHGWIKQMFLQF